MLHPSPRLTIVFVLLAAVTACADGHSPPPSAPPKAEFLLTTRDSTFWVTSDATGVHVRGSPILLARFSGRFFEVYASDDDYSYADALLVGQRVYRRDVRSGDSTLVLGDTLVPRIARAYARAHPDEDPLDPGEDTNDDPGTAATAEVDIGDIFGPYMSYQYHADVALEDSDAWQTARSGVIDLRSARPVRLSDLFGVTGGQRADALGRSAYESTRASARRAAIDRGEGGRRVLAALEHLRFDESSFMLASVHRQPAVIFDVPGTGHGGDGNLLELDPVPLPAVSWWTEVRPVLPDTQHGIARWRHGDLGVLARYDSSGDYAQLALTDDARHEWPVAVVGGPVERVDWIDRPTISAEERRALLRAFDDATSYDDRSRLASGATRRPARRGVTVRSSTAYAVSASHARLEPARHSQPRHGRHHPPTQHTQ